MTEPEKIGDTFTLPDGKVLTLRACEECGDETWNDRLCRDCNLEELWDRSTCSVCKKMRWNDGRDEACKCDPKPPTALQARKAVTP